MALMEDVVQSVANSNFKNMAEMGVQNALSHQHRLNIMAETALGKVLDDMRTTSVPEGLGLAAAQRGDLSKQIMDLSAAVSAMQAQIKAGQTTPPVTA
jgi:hypothetical protein